MPNGKHGDHPLTDILVHKVLVFSPKIDALIVEIAGLGAERQLESKFNLFNPPPREEFERKLRMMRDELRREAKERGWEV
jgi:hypothetical protein